MGDDIARRERGLTKPEDCQVQGKSDVILQQCRAPVSAGLNAYSHAGHLRKMTEEHN